MIRGLTGGIGVDRAIDAVGIDANQPRQGLAARRVELYATHFQQELREIVPEPRPVGDNWHPGEAPSLVAEWTVEALSKAGTLSVIGVYPPSDRFFPFGSAMNKNLTIKMGNCNHRRYIPMLLDLVRPGAINPAEVLTHVKPMSDIVAAYQAFDQRQTGWVKVELVPAA